MILLMALALSLSGCKTKEKVLESCVARTETQVASVVETQGEELTQHIDSSESHGLRDEMRDSIVERTHEYLVMDSTGKVLLHEIDNVREHHAVKAKKERKKSMKRHGETAKDNHKSYEAMIDSMYNASVQSAVSKSTPDSSSRGLWFCGLLLLLIVVGFIIQKGLK